MPDEKGKEENGKRRSLPPRAPDPVRTRPRPWILSNPNHVSRVESLLSYASYFVPSQMRESPNAELASEVIYASLTALRLHRDNAAHAEAWEERERAREGARQFTYHGGDGGGGSGAPLDSSRDAGSASLGAGSATGTERSQVPHWRKTERARASGSRGPDGAHPFNLAREGRALEYIQSVEVALEAAAERTMSEPRRYAVVALIEAAKAAIRLRALWSIGGRMLLPSLLNPRLTAATAPYPSTAAQGGAGVGGGAAGQPAPCFVGSRSGLALSRVADWRRSVRLGSRRDGTPRASAPTPLSAAGEVVFALRPVLRAVLLARAASHGRRGSWTPWIASLVTELAARYMCATGASTAAELRELSRRDRMLALYAVRSPAFERTIASAVRRIATALQGWPLLGALGNVLDYFTSLQRLYFYTAGSSPSSRLLEFPDLGDDGDDDNVGPGNGTASRGYKGTPL